MVEPVQVGALLAFADRLRGVNRMLFESSSEEILCFDDSGSDAANPDSDSKCGEPLGGDSGALRQTPKPLWETPRSGVLRCGYATSLRPTPLGSILASEPRIGNQTVS